MTEGFDVLVHEVMAAMTTAPLSIIAVTPSTAMDTPCSAGDLPLPLAANAVG